MANEKEFVFPYEKPRIGQLELIKSILNLSEKNPVIVVAAPTGFGKTVSVLYSAVKVIKMGSIDRILYVVRTRNELDPVIKEAKSIGIDFTVIYSGRKMCPLAIDKKISNEGFWTICSILRLNNSCQYYNKAKLTSIETIIDIVRKFEDHYSIAKNLANKLNICPYFSLLSLSEETSLTIATYPYLFKEHIWLSTLSHIDPSKTMLVVDEAHNIVNIGGVMGDSIDIESIKIAIEEIQRFYLHDDEVVRVLNRLSMVKVYEKGYKYINKSSIGIDKAIIESISSIATDIALKIVSRVKGSIDEAMNIDLKILKLSKFLNSLSNQYFDLFATVTFNGMIEFHALPISFEPIKNIVELFKSVILMSGTPPSKEFLVDVVKIKKNVSVVDVEDFGASNYVRENSSTVIFSNATTSYRSRDEHVYKIYAELIDEVYKVGGNGIIMTVYPSYDVMWNILKHTKSMEFSVIDKGEPLSVIKDTLSSRNKVVLHTVAGGRLTEGIELTKDGESMVKCIIVIGVPYPQPDDYVDMLRKYIEDRRDIYSNYYIEIAAIRILQAIGRAIRSEKDYALVILADKRYKDPLILKRLKLNIRRITSSLRTIRDIVEQFYSQLS